MGVGIHMPLLVTVLPGLVAFAFYKAKHKGIGIPLLVQIVGMNHIFGLHHEISLKAQKNTCKNKLFAFLLQKELANLFEDIKTHLLLPNNACVTRKFLLIGNVTPDALCELLEVFEEIRLNIITAHAEKMFQCTLTLLVWQEFKAHCLPLTFPLACLLLHDKVDKMQKC
jgi:hypothetical protein